MGYESFHMVLIYTLTPTPKLNWKHLGKRPYISLSIGPMVLECQNKKTWTVSFYVESESEFDF